MLRFNRWLIRMSNRRARPVSVIHSECSGGKRHAEWLRNKLIGSVYQGLFKRAGQKPYRLWFETLLLDLGRNELILFDFLRSRATKYQPMAEELMRSYVESAEIVFRDDVFG